ncbi:DUF2231 domain-containing protein [Candidatus Chrysopegis kryptomonas]|uniref:Uncharacterized membrane protein n=1 Tax=Candidatus Chryseopegocella kryptomonas TaxID=1633643 RepID=A0A0P1MTL9_9BACT|nr:DUF2231 domain-containing protein [Candidatus Chrysopegis kryptomonas]CUS99085.1 Uncharacterized membrane protein [Candidatus Chrysopegis kryptomonas]
MLLHPIVVHFPISLVLLSFIFEFLEFFGKSKFKNSTFLFSGLALFFAIISVQTGNIDSQPLNLNEEVKIILNNHQSNANFSLLALSIIFLFKLHNILRKKEINLKVFIILLSFYLVALFFIFRTAYFGVKLVYDLGVRVKLN